MTIMGMKGVGRWWLKVMAVAAGAVVTSDVQDNAMVAGVPAKTIRFK